MASVVETRYGKVEGTQEAGLHVFRGVPFAAPPVGERRFAPPAPPDPWADVRPAKEFAAVSHQSSIGLGFMGAGKQPQSEDCLYLNVWTPGLDGAKRPVMVWIHGGAFVLGAGSEPLYDGRRLSERGDVVVVTINYRLGALGYLAHSSLIDEGTGACGNWGLLDQIAAIEWVRDNVEAFGGDPTNITIFGESAGSMSVTTIMGTPRAGGLFRRAIAQSGAPEVATAEAAAATAEKVLTMAGIGPDGLRDLPAEAFVEIQQKMMAAGSGGGGLSGDVMAFRPVIDGAVLSRSPFDAIADGEARDVSLLIGSNRDEMKLFAMMDSGTEVTEEVLLRRLGTSLDDADARHAAEVYRKARESRGEPTDPKELWQAMETDRFFRAPAMRFAGLQARHQPDTYAYLFCWESPMAALGSPHAVELPFVFGTLDAPMISMFAGSGPEAESLSVLVQDAWLAFARSGNPAHAGLGEWPSLDSGPRPVMILDRKCGVEDNPRSDELGVWPA